MTEFVSFLQNDIMQNEMLSEFIDTESRTQIDNLALFTNKDELLKQRSSAELGQMFGIDSVMLEQVYAIAGVSSMSIQEFLQFVSNNQAMAASIASNGNAEQMQQIQMIAASVMEEREYSSSEMSALFGGISKEFDEEQIKVLYTLYCSIYETDNTWTMTPVEMLQFVIEDMTQDKKYAGIFDEEAQEKLNTAYTELKDGEKQLKGENHSLMMVSTTLSEESKETNDFLENMNEKYEDGFS